MCEAVTAQWVLWANWRGDLYTFCANDCLARWLKRSLDEACAFGLRLARAGAEKP
jgi:hypothetical protein